MYSHHLTAATDVTWVITTQTAPWLMRKGLAVETGFSVPNVIVRTESPRQVIEGFGATFNELGWTSLAALDAEEREGILRELFAPGGGANFTLCRVPVGANDLSLGWYSSDGRPGDPALAPFSISNDRQPLLAKPEVHKGETPRHRSVRVPGARGSVGAGGHAAEGEVGAHSRRN